MEYVWNYKTDLVLRKPSNEEQFEAKIETSDYQISGLTIQSSILVEMGLLEKMFRSKYTTTQYSTKRMVGKYKGVFGKVFGFYDKTDSVKKIYDEMNLTNRVLTESIGINVRSLFLGFNSWKEVCSQKVLLPYVASMIRGKYDKKRTMVGAFENSCDYEPSDEEVQETKIVYVKLFELLKKVRKNGDSLKKFVSKIRFYESLNSLLDDTSVVNIKDAFMSFPDDKTIGDMRRWSEKIFEGKSKDSVREYSRTVMEKEVLENQREIYDILQKDNMTFDFEGFKYYLSEYKQEVIENLVEKYDLDIMNMESFEEMARWFYEPERMHNIREALGVKVRARSKGQERQGVKWVMNSFNYENKIKSLDEKLSGFNETEANQRIKDLYERLQKRQQENTEAKEARRESMRRLNIARKSKDPELIIKCAKEHQEMVKAATTISKALTATKKSYLAAQNDYKKKLSAIDKVREYREKYGKLLSKMKKDVSNAGDKNVIEGMQKSFKSNLIATDTIPYSTWSFKAYVINEDVIRVVTDELEKGFSGVKDKNGEPAYVNVSSYAYLDENKNAISEFFVDYPRGNKLYKAFEKNPNLSSVLIEGIAKMVKEKLGYYVDFAPEDAKWNVDMEKTLENGDDPLDAWDF